MNVEECRRTLEVGPEAGLEEVKSAFRRLAFKLHPDLNPAPDAAARFRQLNEAYVILRNAFEGGAAPGPSGPTGPTGRGRASGPDDQRMDGAAAEAEAARAFRAYRARQEEAKAQARKKAKAASHGRGGFYYKKEEVLKDILSDPFARQVFEDIYREIRKERPDYRPPSEMRQRRLKLKFGDRDLDLDVSGGVWKGFKAWVKSSMDDHQTVYFPALNLLPGRTVRISVRQSFSGEPRTIEITLPPDFVIGRPIRLKGLGRRLGPVSGDLYLRLLAK